LAEPPWLGEPWPEGESSLAVWDEPRELDTDDESVISLYDGIKRILQNQTKAKFKPKREQGTNISRDARHVLRCGRILRVDVQRKLVVITVMKADGELHQLRIEANED
jgi:hypothetical protein